MVYVREIIPIHGRTIQISEYYNLLYPEWLSGGWEHGFYDFPFSWEFPSIPTDELHFSEGLKPPTSYFMLLLWGFHSINWFTTDL